MEASQLFITSPILIGDVIKERLPIDPKLLKVAYTARYLCNAAKVAYDIRRLPEFEVCVRTQTCIGGIGGVPPSFQNGWFVRNDGASFRIHSHMYVHKKQMKSI